MKKLNKLAAAAIAVILAGTVCAVSAFAEMYGEYDVQGTVSVDDNGNKTIDGISVEEWIAAHEGQTVYYIEDGVIYDLNGEPIVNVDDITSESESETDSTESETDSVESETDSTESTESTESDTSSAESVADSSSTESATTSTESVDPTTSTTSSTAATTSSTTSTATTSTTSTATTSTTSSKATTSTTTSSKTTTTSKDANPKTGVAGIVGAVALLGIGAMTVTKKSKN